MRWSLVLPPTAFLLLLVPLSESFSGDVKTGVAVWDTVKPAPTVLPDRLFAFARDLLAKEATGTAFRLIGIGASPLAAREAADHGDLADTATPRLAAAQAAIDALRDRFGDKAVIKGRSVGAALAGTKTG